MIDNSYTNIINSISHFDNVENIDSRTIFFTAHLKLNTMSTVRKIIPLRLNKLISGTSYPKDITNRAGIIISDDVEGTRQNSPQLVSPKSPHYHGLIILPYDANVKLDDVINAINSIKEISSCTATFYNYEKSLLRVCDYVMKLMTYENINYDFAVYPYEFDLKSARTGATRRANKLHNDILSDPSIAFTKNYLSWFGDELVNIKPK